MATSKLFRHSSRLDPETWHALDQLAKERMQDFQKLADGAFTGLLQKHGRPTDLNALLV
jgi:hypothetical protein